VLLALVTTALRRWELIALDWGDLDLGGPRPSLLVRRGKGGRPRRQALAPGLARELIALRQHTDAGPSDPVFRGLAGGRLQPQPPSLQTNDEFCPRGGQFASLAARRDARYPRSCRPGSRGGRDNPSRKVRTPQGKVVGEPTRGNPRESATETHRRWRGLCRAPHRQG